jgi:hypothetical protein
VGRADAAVVIEEPRAELPAVRKRPPRQRQVVIGCGCTGSPERLVLRLFSVR